MIHSQSGRMKTPVAKGVPSKDSLTQGTLHALKCSDGWLSFSVSDNPEALHLLFEIGLLSEQFQIDSKIVLTNVSEGSHLYEISQPTRVNHLPEEYFGDTAFHQELSCGGNGSIEALGFRTAPDHERTSRPISDATSR